MAKITSKALTVSPVQTLREQCAALESAIELSLAGPRKKAVHQLRTSTRRIEAQLELLGLLRALHPQLGAISGAAMKIRRLLSAVRKAAGRVRDCDVQREMLRAIGRDAKATSLHEDATRLRKTLKHIRDQEAATLEAELTDHTQKLATQLGKLLQHLEQGEDLTVAGADLGVLIQSWYRERAESDATSASALHGVRKAAKLARYMAEPAGLPSLAGKFENVQELGGAWHDAMTLHKIVRRHLGRDSPLLAMLASKEQASLAEFTQALQAEQDW